MPLLASADVAPLLVAVAEADAGASGLAAPFGEAATGAGTIGGYGIGGAPG